MLGDNIAVNDRLRKSYFEFIQGKITEVRLLINVDIELILGLLFKFGEKYSFFYFHLEKERIETLSIYNWSSILNSLKNEIEIKAMVVVLSGLYEVDGIRFFNEHWHGSTDMRRKVIILLNSQRGLFVDNGAMAREIYGIEESWMVNRLSKDIFAELR